MKVFKKCHFCGELKECKRRFCSLKCYHKWLIGKPSKSNTKFKKGEHRSSDTEFRMGHNKGKSSPTKGRHHTDEAKRKIGLAGTGRHHTEESKKKISEAHRGEKHWNWKGGRTFGKYTTDWTKSLRISIRERDKYTCQICGEKQGDKAFSVHHIDYSKKNCCLENLITLCKKCHQKTNFNREKWINFFKNKI